MHKQTRKRKHEHQLGTSSQGEYRNKAKRKGEMSLEDSLNMLLADGFPMKHWDEELEALLLNTDSDSGVGEDDSDDGMITDSIPTLHDEDDDGVFLERTELTMLPDPDFVINDPLDPASIRDTPRPPRPQSESESDDDFNAYGFHGRFPFRSISQRFLRYKKMADLNCDVYSEGPHINSVEFHPSSRIALVAGTSGITNFYSVDGLQNKLLHKGKQEDFPVLCAKFIKNGSKAILGSKFSHIFSFDLESAETTKIKLPSAIQQFDSFIPSPDEKSLAVVGRSGEIHILSSESHELLYTLKQNCDVSALSFNATGELLFSHSTAGTVTIWDTKMRRIKHVFADENCLSGTAINVSPSNQLLATGSLQGIVNLYKMDTVIHNEVPKPEKSIYAMTGINNLKFNHNSEILALSSTNILNSVKLYNLNSGNMFNNFPSIEEKLGYVNVLNFSPNSGYIAFGSHRAVVTLYRLKHYQSY